VDISLQDINSVDKEVIITANREDLQEKFDEAYKNYKKQLAIPGFRPGKVPVSLVRKRFGEEIEKEEINSYVQEVFDDEIVPEYEPVGQSEMVDLSWEDDELEAKFKIGLSPGFELADLETIEVDFMVHDVTDEEAQEELDQQLKEAGDWQEVQQSITETSRITANATLLDSQGEPVEGETDENQVMDLQRREYSAFKEDLLGKKAGDIVTIDIEEEEDSNFKLLIKKVEKWQPARLTDAFAKEQSDEEAKNVDEYKSLLKSRLQDYYDQSAENSFHRELIDALIEAHDFEVPRQFVEQVQNQYVRRLARQSPEPLPEDFDAEGFKAEIEESAIKDAKWFFIDDKLQDKFDDIEIESDDIDEQLAVQAAQYGTTTDDVRSLYAENPDMLESLRNQIREEKVFDRLKDVVNINEMDQEAYEEKQKEKEEQAIKKEQAEREEQAKKEEQKEHEEQAENEEQEENEEQKEDNQS
jgi:trigger factor